MASPGNGNTGPGLPAWGCNVLLVVKGGGGRRVGCGVRTLQTDVAEGEWAVSPDPLPLGGASMGLGKDEVGVVWGWVRMRWGWYGFG